MTTVINNPSGGNGDGGSSGVIVGVLVAIVIIGLFVVYGLPALRNQNRGTTQIKVELPSAPSVNTGTPTPTPAPAPAN